MPEKEKFDLKDISLIVLSCLLIVAVIALSVSFSSYAILYQRFNDCDVKSSEACIASESFERELALNYAMPDSNIVSYTLSNYTSHYVYIDYSTIEDELFFDITLSLDDLIGSSIDNLPTYFQPTAIVYNVVGLMRSEVIDTFYRQETSIIVGGFESNSIYSFSYFTYELSFDWTIMEPYHIFERNSVFSAGDSIHIGGRIDDYFDLLEGMSFEIEYEIEVTRVYGYNLTEYIGEKENDAFRDGEQLGYETGYDDGYDVGYDVGYSAGEGYGYNDGFDDGSEQGYRQGYSDGYDAGVDSFDSLVQGAYDEGYDDGYDVGYDAGVDYGYTSGYTDGFHDGEYEGASSAGDYSFFALVSAVFDAPLKVLIGEWQQDTNGEWQLVGGMLNFDIPGLDVNFAPLLTSLFTISLLLFLLRFILGVVL